MWRHSVARTRAQTRARACVCWGHRQGGRTARVLCAHHEEEAGHRQRGTSTHAHHGELLCGVHCSSVGTGCRDRSLLDDERDDYCIGFRDYVVRPEVSHAKSGAAQRGKQQQSERAREREREGGRELEKLSLCIWLVFSYACVAGLGGARPLAASASCNQAVAVGQLGGSVCNANANTNTSVVECCCIKGSGAAQRALCAAAPNAAQVTKDAVCCRVPWGH